jgi:DNA-directed RNA polymerase I, II, and III subunit RPABC2
MSGIIDTIEDNLKDAIEDLGENLLNLDINNDGQIGSEPEQNEDDDEEEEWLDMEGNVKDDEQFGSEPEKNKDEEEVEKVSDDNEDVSESEDDDDEEEEHFEKFNEHMRKNHIVDFHPESLIHNYEEVKMMATVQRNDKGIIIDELHKTIPILTKYEKTRIIGQRAKQINAGAKPFIQPTKDMMTGYLIAKKEVEEKKTPFIIRRPLPNGGSEYWHLRDLEILY